VAFIQRKVAFYGHYCDFEEIRSKLKSEDFEKKHNKISRFTVFGEKLKIGRHLEFLMAIFPNILAKKINYQYLKKRIFSSFYINMRASKLKKKNGKFFPQVSKWR
jgi:hypothetical protein